MAEPEGISNDLSRIEQKFKLSLQNMEKRFVDLEVAISEIVNQLNSLGETGIGADSGAVEDLRRRVDSLEDLIAVEQAGIAELKDILGNIDKNLSHKFDTQGVEEKIKEVEDIVHIITKRLEKAAEPAKIDKETGERIGNLEKRIEELRGEIGSRIEDMIKEKDRGREEEAEGSKGRDEFEHIAHMEIGQLKQNLRDLEKKFEEKVEERLESFKKDFEVGMSDVKIASTESSKEMLEHFKRYGEELKKGREEFNKYKEELKKYSEELNKYRQEFDKHKQEIENSKERIISLGDSVNNLASNLEKMRVPFDKLQSMEELDKSLVRLENLKKEVDERLKVFNAIEGEIKKLSERVGLMYEELDKRSAFMVNVEKDVKGMHDELGNLRKEQEMLKEEMKRRVRGEELNEIVKRLEQVGGSVDLGLEKRLDERLNKTFNDFNNKVDNFNNKINDFDNRIKDTDNRISGFDGKVSGLDKKFNEFVDKRVNDFDKKINDFNSKANDFNNKANDRLNKIDERLNEMIKKFEEKSKTPEKSPEMEKEIKSLKDEINNVRKVVVKMDETLSKVQEDSQKEPKKDVKSFIKNFGDRMGKVERSLEELRASITELSKESEVEQAQVTYLKEVTDRLVFLESRLAALESVLNRPQPIVLE